MSKPFEQLFDSAVEVVLAGKVNPEGRKALQDIIKNGCKLYQACKNQQQGPGTTGDVYDLEDMKTPVPEPVRSVPQPSAQPSRPRVTTVTTVVNERTSTLRPTPVPTPPTEEYTTTTTEDYGINLDPSTKGLASFFSYITMINQSMQQLPCTSV